MKEIGCEWKKAIIVISYDLNLWKRIERKYFGNIFRELRSARLNERWSAVFYAVALQLTWLRLLRHVCTTCNSHACHRIWYYKFKCSTHIVRVTFPRGDLSQSWHFRTCNYNPLYRYVNTADGDLAEVSPEHIEQWTVSSSDWNADLDAD